MTPHRIGGTGSYRFDRVFSGVGRINRSSGTTKLKEFQKRDQLLTELFEHAQLEALRSFQRGDVSIEELLEAKRLGRLTSSALLADVKLQSGLWESFDSVFPKVHWSDKTAHRYRVSLESFTRKAGAQLSTSARVADLLRLDWKALQRDWGTSAADWNHMRRMLSAGLTKLLGDVYHPFRRDVVKRIPVAREVARTPDLTPELFWRIVLRTPLHAQPCYVVLLATGMRLGEYMRCTRAHLRPNTFAIAVPGTKTDASEATIYVDEQLWDWVIAGVPAPIKEKWIRTHWKRAARAEGAGELRLHDLRHAFGQLASDAGAPTARIQAALRHSSPDMTRRYEMQKARKDVAALVGRAIAPKRAG
jgi:integrase